MPTVVELREKCKSLGLKGYSKLNKSELEKLITRSKMLVPKTVTQVAPQLVSSKGKKLHGIKKADCLPPKTWIVGSGCYAPLAPLVSPAPVLVNTATPPLKSAEIKDIFNECNAFSNNLNVNEKFILKTYQNIGFLQINDSLWYGSPTPEAKFMLNMIKNGLTAKRDFKVYRNFGFLSDKKEVKDFIDRMNVADAGYTIDFKGIMSTTVNEKFFIGIKKVAKIIIPKGKNYLCMPNAKLTMGEMEIMFLPGTLTKIKKSPDTLGTWLYTPN